MARNKYPEVTVQKILDVSSEIFLQKGYENTSINDIAKALKMTKGAIYYHFASKEELLKQVMENFFQDMNWFITIQKDTKTTGLEKIRKVFRHELGDDKKRKMDKLSTPFFKDPTMLLHQLESSVHEVAPVFASFIEEGNADGSLSVEHPGEVAEILLLLINVWLNPFLFPGTITTFQTKMETFNQMMAGLGLPILDEPLKEICINYYKDVTNQTKSK